ncbi:MAG TPA: FHA domain-containing protein [Candidatus Dormibacteraeota bacterium]|nr:FHA domain-containing protein [Candidatus Dormibacteraeota bacterium]
MYQLEVMNGPLDGKTWSFESEITIGRDEAQAHACISTDRYVSRRHAILRAEPDHLSLTDLGSRNGVRVCGRQVTGSVAIAPGETFVVGRTELRVTELS